MNSPGAPVDQSARSPAEQMWQQSREHLLEQQKALASLTRSQVFAGDDLSQTLRLLTKTAATQLGVERASLWRITADRSAIQCLDLYELSSDRHSAGAILRMAEYPAYFGGLAVEEAIVADDAHNHPFTREFSSSYLLPLGIGSMLDVPIHPYGRLEGVFCHEHIGPPIIWSPEQRLFAIAIANLAALAIEQTERRRAEALIRGQRDVLEMIATGASLSQTLNALVRTIEQQDAEVLCSICLLDPSGHQLRHSAAARLPAEYCVAIDGLWIGPSAGSCGTAAFTKQVVVARDIANDARWASFRDLAEAFGLRACFATPIVDSKQHVLGTFALYYRECRDPSDEHLRLIEAATHTAAIALERARSSERIEHLAYYDGLTQLPNRALLQDRVSQVLTLAERDRKPAAVLFIDLDRFKTINDSLGHHVGDRLLEAVARRMQMVLREADTISRWGGDEFVVLLPETDARGAARVSQHLLDKVVGPYSIEGRQLSITPSIGISLYPDDGHSVEMLIRNADTAMYHVKENGRNGYQFFASAMNAAVLERLNLENGLRSAVDARQLALHYQAQIDIATGQVVGAEALLRWHHPELGLVMPNRFIAIAEEAGLIGAIGEWVLREACRQNKEWQRRGIASIPIAVNMSSRQFRGPIAESIGRILQETGLDPSLLELELTEGLMMHSTESTLLELRRLKGQGVTLAIDDFGIGYSSLAYLKRYPIDKLKIDRSFIRDLIVDPEDRAIASAIISMAHSLRLRVVAEGVESEEQLAILRGQRCDAAQGYLFSRPAPAEEFAAFLRCEHSGGRIGVEA